MHERTFYSVAAFAGRGVKAAGSPQSVIILATIKNVQTRRQCVRVRSPGLPRPHRSSSSVRTPREVFRVLADTRIIILFPAEETFFHTGARPRWCIAKLETRDVLLRLNWSLFLSSSRSFALEKRDGWKMEFPYIYIYIYFPGNITIE